MRWQDRTKVAWRLLRPFTLTASIVPVLVGTGMAIAQHQFQADLFVSFLVAAILIQVATNMFNEYFDYLRGLDDENMVGIAGAIVRDGVQPRTVIRWAYALIGISVLLGVYICARSSWWVAAVGTLCIAVAYLYSGGPKPLAYTPFGELAAAITMGPVIVLLAYYLQTGTVTSKAAVTSIPVGLLIGAILLANNIRDMDLDRLGGRRTIAVLIGRERGRLLFAAVFAATYGLVLALIALGALTPWAMLVLLTLPTAVDVVRLYYRHTEPKLLHPAVKGTAVLLLRFGSLMVVGLLASAWLHI